LQPVEVPMSDIRIHTCNEEDRDRWDQFVLSHAEGTNYHRWSWKHVFQEVFGWSAIYLLAEENGVVRGILPLIWQKCLLRSYLSSMPHLKGGGIVATSPRSKICSSIRLWRPRVEPMQVTSNFATLD